MPGGTSKAISTWIALPGLTSPGVRLLHGLVVALLIRGSSSLTDDTARDQHPEKHHRADHAQQKRVLARVGVHRVGRPEHHHCGNAKSERGKILILITDPTMSTAMPTAALIAAIRTAPSRWRRQYRRECSSCGSLVLVLWAAVRRALTRTSSPRCPSGARTTREVDSRSVAVTDGAASSRTVPIAFVVATVRVEAPAWFRSCRCHALPCRFRLWVSGITASTWWRRCRCHCP